MLGVFRRHWKPKRTSNSRKTKDKSKETSDDKSVGVLGAIVVTGHLLKVADDDDNEKQKELDAEKEKSDPVKEPAERPPTDGEQENVQKDGLKQQLEKEKMLRSEAEAQLREVHLECERCKVRLKSLQDDFKKMEEMVCNMLQFKSRIEQLKHEKSSISLAYENKIRKFQSCIASLEKENFMLLNELRTLQTQKDKDHQEEWEHSLSWLLLERLRLLEQENSSLVLENEQQRLQYEHCLDDVANQVVQALLTQKSLREECSKLQRRVQDLERQNHTLTLMFKQCLFHTAGSSDQLGCDSQSKWQKPLYSESNEDSWLENAQVQKNLQQHASHDSPSHNSQSEDSTESLASMCSDYSTHSGSSGGNPMMSYPGLPKMSSPPQWLKERSVYEKKGKTFTNVSSTSYMKSPLCNNKSGHIRSKLSEQDILHPFVLESGKTEYRSLFPLRDRNQCKIMKEGMTYAPIAVNIQENDATSRDEEWTKCGKMDLSKKIVLHNDIGSLDAMETPMDDCLNVDSLSLISSSQKLLVSSQYKPNNNFVSNGYTELEEFNQNSETKPQNIDIPSIVNVNEKLNSAGQNFVYRTKSSISVPTVVATGISVPRPTTLNIIPHVMSDPAHNFSFPALECKSHILNECGNVYEDIDAPLFPETSQYDKTSETDSERLDNENILNQLGSSSEEGEIAMNTVIRKPHTINVTNEINCQSTNTQCNEQQQLRIPARELPPTPINDFDQNKSSDKNQDWTNVSQTFVLKTCISSPIPTSVTNHVTFSMSNIDTVQESNSPLSVVSEHGNKDEGYSTMSSDVQEITGDCVPHIRQLCTSPLPVNSFSHIEKSLSNLNEGTEAVLPPQENNLNSKQYLQPLSEEDTEDARVEEEEEEACSGFERDLDSSLIRNDKSNSVIKADCDENEIETIEQVNNYNDECKIQNSCDSSILTTCTNPLGEEIIESSLNHSVKSRILPAYDKIITLLTPQGFKSHRNDPRHITLPFIQYSKTIVDSTYPPKQRTQTAEKATITDEDSSNVLKTELLNNSSLSLISLENTDKRKTIKSMFESGDNVYFNRKDIRNSTVSDSCIVYKEINIRPKSMISSEDLELYKLKNRFCKRHHHHRHHHHHYQNDYQCVCQEQRSMQRFKGILCSGKLARTLSDSHLFIREYYNPAFEFIKPASIGIKNPAKRFNLIPLECHTSACDLSSPSRLTPPLRRSQRQVLISDDVEAAEKLQQDILINQEEIWKKKSQYSPTISLSSVHSSTSGEIGCGDDDEELGATSLKCSRDPDLSSESEDECDLLEHHSFVQEWLQREDSQITSTNQADYTYDDEEIGNWSLQLSNTEVKSVENNSTMWENQWNQPNDAVFPDKSYIHQLEKIQETTLEDEYQDDYWNSGLWNTNELQSSLQLDDKTCDNFIKKEIETTDIKNSITNITEDKIVLSHPDVDNNVESNDQNDTLSLKNYDFQESSAITVTDTDIIRDECCNIIIPEEKTDFNSLQCEATEFNRDFYRLCMVGSTRSLVTSECGSHTGSHTEAEQPSENTVEQNETQITLPDQESKVTVNESESSVIDKSSNNESKMENETALSSETTCNESKCQIDENTEKEMTGKEITKDKIPPAIPPKKKLQITKTAGLKNDTNYLGHPYSKVTIDKLYLHEKTKISAGSSRLMSDKRKKNSTRILYTTKTKTHEQSKHSEDHSRKLHKDSLNNSSVRKTIIEKKIYRQTSRDSHKHNVSNPSTVSVTPLEKSSKLIKSSEDKEKKEIKLKNRMQKSTTQHKPKSVKLNEISGLSEKDNFDLEKRLAGEGGHMSVAAKIQELNAFIKNESEKSRVTIQKVKPKKNVPEERKDLIQEKKKEVQIKEATIIKKSNIKEGCGTSWVHVEADIDLSDPKARANLLDSMMASSSSSNSETEEEGEDEVLEHKHHQRLHALHRFRRHKKRATDKDAVISFIPRMRASIIDRHDFYYRYGEKEREAVACFDFLDDMSTSPSDVGSCELLGREVVENNNNINQLAHSCPDNTIKPSRFSLDDTKLSCNRRHARENHLSTTTLNSQDGEIIDHISLSDSCAESYSSSTHSLNHIL
ncbi:repetitive organellar protein-like isoform X2 [Centruroides vittatus]|uniref:repetitive organellar protein-like isoform X2 n=1 Tax=Centruroides vittatus TaxID=120091 RepID=UPI00350F0B32